MDPNTTLDEIRSMCSKHPYLDREDVARFIELVEGLDSWMTKGGFLPAAWNLPYHADRAAP